MKLSLSENIRSLRKQRKMTQQQLAEALGVTVGAVYKWESGLSQPELGLIVEIADFFDTSVDALLGYRMKDNRLSSALERLATYCQTLDPAGIAEAEKTLGKYPHSFKAVYGCAKVYLAFGASSRDQRQLRRALDLFERSKALLPHNDDPRIGESTVCGDMANTWFMLGEYEKSLELLKSNNKDGVFDGRIGACMAIYANRPEEAAPFLSRTLLDVISTLFTTVVGHVFLYRSRQDWGSALAIAAWGVGCLDGLRANVETDAGPNALDKAIAELLALLSYVQSMAGTQEDSRDSLRKAAGLALRFDSKPDYRLDIVRHIGETSQAVFIDVFGATACGAVADLLRLLNDRAMLDRWEKAVGNGQ